MDYGGKVGIKVDNCGDNLKVLWITMFIGQYTYNLDPKRRLAVPVKFRNQLKKRAVITRGLDNCLFLYPLEEWKKLAQRLSQLPISQADARGFARMMLAGAIDVSIDNLGRILIPEYLAKYAGLNKKIVIAGLYNRIEIWDEKKWQTYQQRTEKEAGDIAERLKELGV